jgi:phage FluMu gp28-like protein
MDPKSTPTPRSGGGSGVKELGRAIGEKLRDYLLPYQWEWVCDNSPMKLGRKGRRTGWTYAEGCRSVLKRMQGLRDHWFTSADETASREFIDYCRFWSGFFGSAAKIVDDIQVLDPKTGATVFCLRFTNGRKITALSSNPKGLRSKGGDTTWDEAAYHDHPREMYRALQPTTMWGGQLSIFSNPNRQGDLFDELCDEAEGVRSGRLDPARDHVPDWSYYRITIEDAVAQGLVEKIKNLSKPDPAARAEFLADLRAKARDDDTWLKEYMCVSAGDENVLLTYDLITSCMMPPEELLGRYGSGGLYAGFDVGREKDLTILTAGEAVGKVLFTRHFLTMAKTKYREQELTVRDYWARHRITRFCGDATGIGDMLCEYLQDRFGVRRVEKVKFTNEVKEDLATGLHQKMTDKEIWLPRMTQIREGLHKIKKIITSAGNVRYDAASDKAGHADEFWGFALMAHAFSAMRHRKLNRGGARSKPPGM